MSGRAPADLHHPEIWFQGGEWIVGDFGGRASRCRQQGRFAGVWQSSQPDIGNQPQLEPQIALLAWFTQLRDARRLPNGCLEMDIAETAPAAPGDPKCLTLFGQVGNDLVSCRRPKSPSRPAP